MVRIKAGGILTLIIATAVMILAMGIVGVTHAAVIPIPPTNIPISDGFDYPLGTPDGVGYGVEGYGGLAFLEQYDYQLDGYPEYHPGEDWNDDDSGRDWNGDSNDAGDPVYAISTGIVRYAQYQSEGWGYLVLIEHKPLQGQKFISPDGTGLTTVWSQYGHLASIDPNIQKNQPVRRRQQIGIVGDYPHGSGEAYHLHFEIRIQYRDPWAFVHNTWSNETDYQPWPESRVRVYYTDPSDFINHHRPQIAPLIGDWTGDNIDTTGTFNPRTSSFSLDNGATALMGEPGDLPLVGDWDGSDGKDTIGVYRPKTAQFFRDDNNDGVRDYELINFGDIGDFPIVGDWDGDGDDDIGVFRSLDFATGNTTFFLNKSDGSVEPIEFGMQTDIPIIGDWDNDGIDDIGVFRRNDPEHENNAVFYLKIGTETIDIVYGNNDDIPIVGKWDSDGLTKIGVYRPSTQQFIFNHTPLVDSGNPQIWHVDDDLQDYPNADFARIQDAVDAASAGDIIIVYPGTYTENVDVNKDHLTIKSENGADSTIVQAADLSDHVFEINTDYVNISGFTATGAMGNDKSGFHLFYGDHCNISCNRANDNYYVGISLYSSDDNIVSNNLANENIGGIRLYSSNNNIIENSIFSDNEYGILIFNAYNNSIHSNNFIDNIDNAYSSSSTNTWNYPEQITYYYLGNTYTNYLGNYWDDYTDIDSNNDGIWDNPYNIDSDNDNYPLVEPWENYVIAPPAPNQPPTCAIELQKNGIPIDNINAGEFFDIYVGGSTDDQGIKEVRFSSDESQDSNPTGEWTDWYDWDTSSGDWDAANKIKAWSFATGGDKEVWTEIKDGDGEADRCRANIFAHPGYAIIVAGQDRGLTSQKSAIDHSANNAYRVLHNLGFDDDHIFYLNDESQQIDGQNVVDKSASLDTLRNTLDEIKYNIGESPTPLILYLVGHGTKDVFDFYTESDALSSFDFRYMLEPFNDNLMLIVIGSCYSGSFITLDILADSISGNNRIIITACHDDEERISALGLGGWYHSSDRFWGNLNNGLNVKDAFITNAWPGDRKHLWLDDNGDNIGHPPDNLGNDGALASTTIIGVPGTDDLKLMSWYSVWIHSPGELRVYDSQNRVTGLVNGEIKGEIPNSMYDEQDEIVAIFSSSDSYRYDIAGTDEGTYGLDIASIEDGEGTIFTATDIPTAAGATHEYAIDWAALSQDEAGVTVQVDSDGDGTFEYTFTADNELTQEEFLSGTDREPIPEFTTIAIPVAIVLGLIFIISRRKRKV
ncbi:Cell surface glycoprotein [ANME-1 cluster archaeon GoMg2]|nr:Cell surface glycoprotein [ANME-1 cluster archaeon GoMg2]